MNARPSLIVGATLVFGCLALGWLLAPTTAVRAPAAPANPDVIDWLRYRTVPVGNYIVVSDTSTGECWARLVQEPQIKDAPEKAWVPLGSPLKRK
jgi:hypothetical protein